jgi:hypothetical protein
MVIKILLNLLRDFHDGKKGSKVGGGSFDIELAELIVEVLFFLLLPEIGTDDELCERLIMHGVVSLFKDILDRVDYNSSSITDQNGNKTEEQTSLNNSQQIQAMKEPYRLMKLKCWATSLSILARPDSSLKVLIFHFFFLCLNESNKISFSIFLSWIRKVL